MKVYIVEKGEFAEGGHIIGVYATIDLARASAKETMAKYEFGSWKETDTDRREDSCDWVRVTEYEVQT